MDEEDEKKTKKRDWSSTIQSIIQFIKYMANPVIFWAVVILALLIIVVGYVSYFLSIPGQILGKLTSWLTSAKNALGNIGLTDGKITATQSEIVELCNYLEEMGYDVEGYGFVESIKRTGNKTYDDDSFDGEPSRGTIEEGSVKSKYLEAYIISEKKMFAVSNPKSNWQAMLNEDDFAISIVKQALEILQATQETTIGKLNDYITEYINNNGGTRDEIIQSIATHYAYTCYQSTTLGNAIWTAIVNLFGGSNSPFIEWLNEVDADFEGALKAYIKEKLNGFEAEYRYAGDGLIFLDENDEKAYNPLYGAWVFKGNATSYEFEIDAEARLLFIRTKMDPGDFTLLDILGLTNLLEYAYDLNNWTTKYGKSQEFLISTHIATMAPDFAYKLATSETTDTKVHVSLFESDLELLLVTENNSDVSVLDLLKLADTDDTILKGLKERHEFTELLGKIYFTDIPQEEINNIRPRVEQYFKRQSNARPGGVDDRDQLPDGTVIDDTFINNQTVNAYKYKITHASSITELFKYLDKLTADKFSYYKEILENLTLENLGFTYPAECEPIADIPFSFYAVLMEIIEQKINNTYNIATPYITKVVKHWYRNQYFINVGDGDTLSAKKERLKKMIYDVYNIMFDGVLDDSQADLPPNWDYGKVYELMDKKRDQVDAAKDEGEVNNLFDRMEKKL